MYIYNILVYILRIYVDARQGKCYITVNDKKQCIESLPIKLSKMDCCCGKNMGKAWGDGCDICPDRDKGIVLRIADCIAHCPNTRTQYEYLHEYLHTIYYTPPSSTARR